MVGVRRGDNGTGRREFLGEGGGGGEGRGGEGGGEGRGGKRKGRGRKKGRGGSKGTCTCMYIKTKRHLNCYMVKL